jgi:sortase (surface protein transpeptidase)
MKIRLQTVPRLHRQKLIRVRKVLRGRRLPKLHSPLRRAATTVLRTLFLFFSISSFLILAVLFVPDVYYRVFSADTQPVSTYQEQASKEAQQAKPTPVPSPRVVPAQDETLPEGEWLVIPRIGVRSQLQDTQTPEEALAKGIWWVPDYGQPGDTDIPMIVAGHRFGWQWWWKTDYWKYNSFYNLPELQAGDRVEVIVDQRKWVYEIYTVEEGQEITDYQADLILYTCKFLNSPVRYFLYAELVPPTL